MNSAYKRVIHRYGSLTLKRIWIGRFQRIPYLTLIKESGKLAKKPWETSFKLIQYLIRLSDIVSQWILWLDFYFLSASAVKKKYFGFSLHLPKFKLKNNQKWRDYTVFTMWPSVMSSRWSKSWKYSSTNTFLIYTDILKTKKFLTLFGSKNGSNLVSFTVFLLVYAWEYGTIFLHWAHVSCSVRCWLCWKLWVLIFCSWTWMI